MKRIPLVKMIIGVLIILFIVYTMNIIKVLGENNLTKDNAEKRALEFADAVNYSYKDPEKIYAFMSSEYKEKISAIDFVKAFEKERSYPYLTPLFINFSHVELSKNKTEGIALYSQAARLPGMIYNVELVFENNNYYIYAFEDFLDGSYLKKFENLSYSLDSYFDFKK
jgi:hypothetical protein